MEVSLLSNVYPFVIEGMDVLVIRPNEKERIERPSGIPQSSDHYGKTIFKAPADKMEKGKETGQMSVLPNHTRVIHITLFGMNPSLFVEAENFPPLTP